MKIPTSIEALQYCPKCGSPTTRSNTSLRICTSCGYHTYSNPIPTNGVIIESPDSTILLVKRAVQPKKGMWDVPGGFIETNETLETSVERELKEELGLVVKMNSIVGIYPDTYEYQGVLESTLTIMVSASIVSGTPIPADDVASFSFVPKTEVLQLRVAFSAVFAGLQDYLASSRST